MSRNVQAFLDELSKRATDVDWLGRYAEACQVPGATLVDYAPRLVRLDSECSVIAAIHFRGRDLNFPFVDLSAQSAALPRSLRGAIVPFLRFRPRAVRVWRSEGDAAPDNARDDLLVLLGHIPALLAAPSLRYAERVQLQTDSTQDSYADYRRIYDALFSADPTSARFAQPEDASSLHQCGQAGAFFRVLVDGATAGFIAARPESFRAWQGWCVVEEVLHPDFRGQGFAAAMQQAFLRKLDLHRGSTIFGTIDAGNTPSIKTALRVGRQVGEVGTFVFVDSDGPGVARGLTSA